MNKNVLAAAALIALAGTAAAQSSVTLYGRLGAAIAQQADAVDQKELRNDMGSRLGVRGVEDLGGGLKAVFDLQHRFNTDTGTPSNATRFWEGRSIVGLETGFGRFTLGREENPAYTQAQDPADPWGTYTVAANGSIINGRIGTTRYSNAANYAAKFGPVSFGAQLAEAEGNPNGDQADVDRPWSLGLGYSGGALRLGLGYENPADADDSWATLLASYDFGFARLGGFYGTGRNTDDQKHQAYLLSLVAPLGPGELRASYGELKNKDLDVEADRQWALGYVYRLSKRTSVYATVAQERREDLPADREKTGYDLGVRHDF